MPNVQVPRYFPGKEFETEKDGVCPINRVAFTNAVANNILVATAVTGKIIMPVSLSIFSNAATPSKTAFRSGFGGTIIHYLNASAIGVGSTPYPFNPAGWMRTAAGVGLYVDFIDQITYLSVEWVEYTP